MKLLGNLDGISPATYPKHPYEIVNQLTLKARLGPLLFCVTRNDAHHDLLSTQSAHFRAVPRSQETGERSASSSATATTRSTAAHGVPSARELHCETARRAEVPPNAMYSGRAHVHNIWLSTVCFGETRRVVRARCAEQVLFQLRNDPGWLEQIAPVKGPTPVLEVRASGDPSLMKAERGAPIAPAVVVAARGGQVDAQHTGVWVTAELAKQLPSLVALQEVRDGTLDEQMQQHLLKG